MKVLALAIAITLLAPAPALASSTWQMEERTRVTVAQWDMNEGPRRRIMHDSAGTPNNGRIGSKVEPRRGTFKFPGRGFSPAERQVYDPRRIVVVPDATALDPQTSAYEVRVRFRTRRWPDPNIVQKGQSGQPGGFWKLTLFHGRHPRCHYRDQTGTTSAISLLNLDVTNNRWTVLRCIRNERGTTIVARQGGRRWTNNNPKVIGNINSPHEFVVGGKIHCKAVGVGCDYFGGEYDYVRVYKGRRD